MSSFIMFSVSCKLVSFKLDPQKLMFIGSALRASNKCLYVFNVFMSHIIKVFEKIVVFRLGSYLDELHLYNPRQHGFRPGRSCLSQLLEHQQEILGSLEDRFDVDVIYLDFAKAFDKVDFGILL